MKLLTVLLVTICLLGCSSVKLRTENGFLMHENLYRVPILTNESWLRAIPAGNIDALYLRCPDEQRIAILYTMICGHWNYEEMTATDYANRLYLNSYWKFGQNFFCPPGTTSPLAEKKFKKFVSDPVVSEKTKSFEIVYETTWDSRICSSDKTPIQVKVMDVFMEDTKFHYYYGAANTRFVILRYASPEDQFESGLSDFKSIVSNFQWIE